MISADSFPDTQVLEGSQGAATAPAGAAEAVAAAPVAAAAGNSGADFGADSIPEVTPAASPVGPTDVAEVQVQLEPAMAAAATPMEVDDELKGPISVDLALGGRCPAPGHSAPEHRAVQLVTLRAWGAADRWWMAGRT